jgi:hypothetical protein
MLLFCDSCVQVFGRPRSHHRVKPCFDHVLGLTHYVSLR